MEPLKVSITIYFLLYIFLMVNTQNTTSASSAATLPASSTYTPSSASTVISTTQVTSSAVTSPAVTLSSTTYAALTTSTLSPTLSTNTTTTAPLTTTLSTNTITISTTLSSNSTTSSPLSTANVTSSSVTTSGNDTSPNSTVQSETNMTVLPNVTSPSQNITAVSPNDTVTNGTEAPVTSPSNAPTESSSGTPGLTSPITTTSPLTSSASSPTATYSPTGPPQGNTVVLVLKAVNNGYHPAKVNFTLDTIKRWSNVLCDSKTLKSEINLKIHSVSDYFYDIINVTASPGSTQSNNFVCTVADLPNLSLRTYGIMNCSRDSQSCSAGKSVGQCASITIKTDQCSVSFFWASDQNVTIVYNSNVLQLTCKDGNINCSADSGVSQVTGPTLSPEAPQASASPNVSGEKGHSGVILGVILSLLVVFIALVLGVLWKRQRSGRQRGSVQFHNDGSHPRASKPVGIRIGEKRTLQRLESTNSNDTEFDFTSVNLSPTSPSPQASIDVSSGQKMH